MVRTLTESGARAGRRIVVAGEMLELGSEGARMHRETGRAIAQSGVDLLWGVRGLAEEMVKGAREAGMTGASARFFDNADEAAAALPDELRAGDLVLVKGSRGVKTDKVVKMLRDRLPLIGGDEAEGQ
jgi:UDP-N-acetylmuramoyl-tripeptide--D-alanyl-D-alanine ligase